MVYILDLGGNTRHHPELSGTTHNVFGIQVGVAITFLVRRPGVEGSTKLYYAETARKAKRTEKYNALATWDHISAVQWKEIKPDAANNWLNSGGADFKQLLSFGSKLTRGEETQETLVRSFSLGIGTNRDAWVYGFHVEDIAILVPRMLKTYNDERSAFQEARKEGLKYSVCRDEKKIKWTDRLSSALRANRHLQFVKTRIGPAQYRPFSARSLYSDPILNHRPGQQPQFFPTSVRENVAMAATGVGAERPFATFATRTVPDLNFFGPGTVPNWFPFYTYGKDGSNRRENITDWALAKFRNHYTDETITKWNIFHATYAILHHPEYRTRYAANLKRELPRIPFPPDLHTFAPAGKRLMELHIDYEQQPEYKLEQIEDPKAEVTFRVERMKLSKDKSELRYNSFLTLRGIPSAAFDYRLGNRSALEWVIDQYRVSTDSRSSITNDPNREDDPKYILRLIGQVISVSLETPQIIAGLPTLNLESR